MRQRKTLLIWPCILFLVWTLATYVFEGRIHLYQQPTIQDRYVYVLIVNVLIGTVGAAYVAHRLLFRPLSSFRKMGFQPAGRILGSVVLALVTGGVYLWVMRPASSSSLVVFNGYLQVLPVSIAEVLVCWALIGTSFESAAGNYGKTTGLLTGVGAATVLFSVYHLGHSAPFNQIEMMLFLLVPGLVTSLFFFASREIYGTILFHNFQGTIGVVSNLENPEMLNQFAYPLYLLAAVALAALVTSHVLLVRRAST